jgi:hypothetical protein
LIKIVGVIKRNRVPRSVAHDELAIALELRAHGDKLARRRDQLQPALAALTRRLPAAMIRWLGAVYRGDALHLHLAARAACTRVRASFAARARAHASRATHAARARARRDVLAGQ